MSEPDLSTAVERFHCGSDLPSSFVEDCFTHSCFTVKNVSALYINSQVVKKNFLSNVTENLVLLVYCHVLL